MIFPSMGINTNNDEINNAIRHALDESVIVAVTDIYGKIMYVNKSFCRISKYSEKELLGQNHRILKSGEHPPSFFENMWRIIRSGKTWEGEIKNKAKDGMYYWVKTYIVPFFEGPKITKFVSIRTDITQEKKLEEILKENKKKDEFMAILNHELKTPLFVIKGNLELLIEIYRDNSNESLLDVINDCYQNTSRLENLINDMLELKKLEIRKVKFNKKPFILYDFMNVLHQEFLIYTNVKKITFTNTTVEKWVLKSDEEKLIQVFGNLIKNAVDFVEEKTGSIEIGARRKGNEIIFHVKDNGMGIPKEKQSLLFTKFYSENMNHTRKHGGTGLGLAICKEIVEALGGKIWIESEQGVGTTVAFSIILEEK